MPLSGARLTVAAYLPVFVAVVLRMTVAFVCAATKMMQPFSALASPASATTAQRVARRGAAAGAGANHGNAAALLGTSYLAMNDWLDPWHALSSGHGAMFAAATLHLVVIVMAPFASEMLTITSFCYKVSRPDSSNNTIALVASAVAAEATTRTTTIACGPEVRMSYGIARVLQALLAAAAALLVALGILLKRRACRYSQQVGTACGGRCSCGVYQDPSAIASLAALLHHPDVLGDLRSVDPNASKADMLAALGDRNYALGWYVAPNGAERYGVVPAAAAAAAAATKASSGRDAGNTTTAGGIAAAYAPVKNAAFTSTTAASVQPDKSSTLPLLMPRRPEPRWRALMRQWRALGRQWHKTARVLRDAVLALMMAGTLALLAVLYATDHDAHPLGRFMHRRHFGARFLMTVICTFISGEWYRKERRKLVFAVSLGGVFLIFIIEPTGHIVLFLCLR